jgi:hypothetical protein
MLVAAAAGGPERFHLGEDPLAELVTGPSEREGRVGVEALEPAGARLAADPARKLGPQAALLLVAALETLTEGGILTGKTSEALDTTASLEPRDRRRQVPAGDPVRRRERLARLVERSLLRHRRPAEGAADDYPPERPRGPAELALHDRAVIVHRA